MFQVVEGGEKYAEQDLMVCGELFTLLVEVCRSMQKYPEVCRSMQKQAEHSGPDGLW